MTDFSEARNVKCKKCGQWFCDVEGPLCDCESFYRCKRCDEEFKDEELDEDGYCDNCLDEIAKENKEEEDEEI